jgi:hypothetical protein
MDKDSSGNVVLNEVKQRDKWDYIEILGRPIAAFFTALAIAGIGYFGQLALADREAKLNARMSERQKAETQRTTLEQNYRLYTQLMSNREMSESGLRKDMFTAILKDFFKKSDTIEKDLSGRLLKLEILALNFGEALSLSPLFLQMDRDIEKMLQEENSSPDKSQEITEKEITAYRKRLHGLAKRVSGWQLAALGSGGKLFEFEFPLEKATETSSYTWPNDHVQTEFEAETNDPSPEDFFARISSYSNQELDNITRSYTFIFSNADQHRKTVKVELEIQEIDGKTNGVTEIEFSLNYFNFPMVDNTRLSNNQRFALVIENFNGDTIKVAGICFRGLHASQRDKPFLDEVIDQLKRDAESQTAPPASPPAQESAKEG